MRSKSAQKKLAKQKQTPRGNVESEVWLLSLKRTTWKQRRDILASEKSLQPTKIITPPVISQLSWYGAACFRPCFFVQQQAFEYSISYKAGTSKVLGWPKSHLPKWLVKTENKKKFFAKANPLVDKILSSSRMKLSNSQTLILDGVETGLLFSVLLNNCVAKTQMFPTFTLPYLTLLEFLPLWFWITMPKPKKEKKKRKKKISKSHSLMLLMSLLAS